MAVCVEIPHCSVQHLHYLAISQTLSNPYFCNNYRGLLNTCFLALSTYILKKYISNQLDTKYQFKCIFCIISSRRYTSFCSKMATQYSYWVALINIILIIISNPSILNPGPIQKPSKVSVLYQNVQGFIPFGELGKVNPMLNTIKMANFQAYIFDKKRDIVLLNETWLSKNISDNEIFPNQT